MSSANWPSVKAGTAAAVCAATVAVSALPAAAAGSPGDGPHVTGDAPSTTSAARLDHPGVQVRTAPDVDEPPDVSALSWMVTDADDGRVLAAKDAHRELPPASTLKTLFAVTVLPKFGQETVHTVSEDDLSGISPGSSLVGIKEDLRYTVADLWRGVFLSSGSDAVRTLAAMNGGWEVTLEDMRAMADRLGARDTDVESADGYDTPGQHSSAYDLTLFAKTGLTNRDFARFASTEEAQFPEAGGPDSFGIQNTNRLLVGSHGVEPYPGLIGVKNGYTSQAGNTLIAAAHHDGRTLLVTVMNPQSGKNNAVYEEARSLLDWGFEAAPDIEPVAMLPDRVGPQPSPSPEPDADGPASHEPADDRADRAAHRRATDRAAVLRAASVGRDAGTPDGPGPGVWWLTAAGAVLVSGFTVVVWRRRQD
ncbi:D-alanyl-D-alanine carboxypeptidase [Streptomyces sp. NBC_01525]|uniref:D-alanyl-D-alanine carboxypeptidase family protein n=1 Tax=Streptomyces sp. NBC_01525 TaxID=2903893 RepID=UPI00386979D7